MATYTISTPIDNSTDAAFRLWSKGISDTIGTAWTQTSDTGQINFTTVTRPTVANTQVGYTIHRMNDTLQSTTPCFLKIEYACGNSAAYPSIFISVGTNTDGAGNLTGTVSARFQTGLQAGNTGYYTGKYSVANNRLVFQLWNTNYGPIVAIERTHDASGGDTSVGIMMFIEGFSGTSTAGAAWSCAVIPGYTSSYGISPYSLYWYGVLPPNSTTAAQGSNVYLYPIRTWGINGETSPSNQLMLYYNQDLTYYNPTNIKMWDGVTRTMMPMGVPSVQPVYGPSAGLAMRFD